MNTKTDSLSPVELNIELYRKLYLARRSEEYIIKHYAEDEMKSPMHMSMGQEAIAVGVCQALDPEDQIWTSYRSHAAFLAKTGDPDKFFAEMYGKVTGTASGKAGSMHLSDPSKGHMASSAVVASVIPAAVGMAFANKQQSNGRVSCVFFGDGAVEEGVFWESLNVACVMKLPVLFVCEDNGLAQHTSSHVRHGYPSITRIVSEFDCNSIEEDSTDVTRIYSLAKEAIALTRSTQKPSFLQLHCYRYLEHVGIYEDFNAGYRSREDYETYLEKDCLKLQRKRLVTEGFSASEVERVESAIEQQIQASLRLARQAPFPDAQEVYYGVFHEAN